MSYQVRTVAISLHCVDLISVAVSALLSRPGWLGSVMMMVNKSELPPGDPGALLSSQNSSVNTDNKPKTVRGERRGGGGGQQQMVTSPDALI